MDLKPEPHGHVGQKTSRIRNVGMSSDSMHILDEAHFKRGRVRENVEGKEIIVTIKEQNVMRNMYQMLQLILQGKMEGKARTR